MAGRSARGAFFHGWPQKRKACSRLRSLPVPSPPECSSRRVLAARRRRRILGGLSPWLLVTVLALGLFQGVFSGLGASASLQPAVRGTPTKPLPQSSELLASRSIWSRPESYPLDQRPRADLYRPSAEWIGRLILPTAQEIAAAEAPPEDWVWIELEQAPDLQQSLIGKRLRLQWADRPELQRLVEGVTTTIQLGKEARQAVADGNEVPIRLNGRRVGPLQSLAGVRRRDDLTVALEGVRLETVTLNEAGLEGGNLRISRPPVQITGRWQGLVTVVGPAAGEDLWRVRHFNPTSGGFDGESETLRIPALPPDRYGRRMLDPAGLAASPLNGQGWLIQGAPARDGVFTVQALTPYAWLELTPSRVVRGTAPSLGYVRHHSWRSPLRRGSLQSTALIPDEVIPPAWGLGDRALLMHLFGGIGGKDGEPVQGWTVTGHFAFGEAEVVRDAFTGRPRLAIRYHQIYANNPNGIVSGSQDWSSYAGSLQRGWLGLRPFSDVLVPMGPEVLEAIELQAELMAARYRSGDGRGVALVTPSTSCVQDSAQALWIAIRQLRLEGVKGPMSELDLERLWELGEAFEHLLEPFGRVRGDWSRNAANALAVGTGSGRSDSAASLSGDSFEASQSVHDALLSWRSLLPRSAHDQFTAEFLRAGLPLLALRTNQIPGANPRLEPVAPTALFGQLPGVSLMLGRLGDGMFPLWNPGGQGAGLVVAVVYGGTALVVGRRSGLLPGVWRWPSPRTMLPCAGRLFFPAFGEELVFRGLLLPSALNGVQPLELLPWMGLSIGLFVAWHGLKGRLSRQAQRRFRSDDPRVLIQTALLGVGCTTVYVVSGSLWWAVLLHWLALVLWREALGAGRTAVAAGEPNVVPLSRHRHLGIDQRGASDGDRDAMGTGG
jgi:predicted Abi (CAAX) family protease